MGMIEIPGKHMMTTVVLTLLLGVLFLSESVAEDITVVTEHFPPYSYEENGIIKGMSTDVINAVLQKVGIDATIWLYP